MTPWDVKLAGALQWSVDYPQFELLFQLFPISQRKMAR